MYSHKSFDETPDVGYSRLNGLVGRAVSAAGIVRVIMIEMPVPVKPRMKMIYSHKSFDETPDVGYSRSNGLVGRTVSAAGIAP